MNYSAIRQKARQLISGNRKAFAPFILLTLILNVSQLAPFLRRILTSASTGNFANPTLPVWLSLSTTIVSLIISACFLSLTLGLLSLFRKNKQGALAVSDAGLIFSRPFLGKAIKVALLQFVIYAVFYLIALAGIFFYSITILGIASGAITSEATVLINLIVILVLFITWFVLMVRYIYHFSMTYFILYDSISQNSYTRAWDCLMESRAMMKGYKFRFFILQLSFLGWYLLIPLTLGLASFYVIPYYQAATAVFYETVKEGFSVLIVSDDEE
ncbi:DUF975 family protein [Streptococcus sp. DD12]|uniref:DUF975 family protein n=1 Tax=Streptococcus sp. DD12 TaxID=1777880 RepID=UPI0007940864|nr:DUF975 family protein [Streptococcus sp. DD12]KXT75390.1 hypothetical protein STRDD12_01511 [Streptococcus sp. DD12]